MKNDSLQTMDLAFDFGLEWPATRPIARCVSDFPPSFEQIVDAHYQGLFRFAVSMCHSEATAQDLVQQTFLQWARKGHMLRDCSKVKTWLYTTIYREWLSIARKEKSMRRWSLNPICTAAHSPKVKRKRQTWIATHCKKRSANLTRPTEHRWCCFI